MKDGEIIKILRRLDALMWKQRELLDLIEQSGHPNAEAMYEDLDQQCAQYPWPTHVGSHHLEHADHYECGDFGIRRRHRETSSDICAKCHASKKRGPSNDLCCCDGI